MRRALFACVLLLPLGGCGPSYPNCKTDEDCNKEKPRNEFCVNQTCQQCRNDKDCPAGKQCSKGRCDAIPGYCADDSACPQGTSCIDNRCHACTSDDQCGEGGKCKKGTCVRKGMCQVEEDCPEGQDCKEGRCVGGPKRASQEAPCQLQPVYFDYNESTLSGDANATILKNASCIREVGRAVQLLGRCDPRGTEEYNLALSERRAQQVQRQLMTLSIDRHKLHTLPKGELEATGRDEQGWANDRRVDFEWQ